MNAQDWVKSIIRGVMCLSGIIGNNLLVLRSLPRSRSQVRTNDILFINLALSNLITNCMVDLPDTLDFVSFAGTKYCGTFNFCSDLSETSSIFTTMFITVFWHQKLVGSLKRGGAPVQMDNVHLVAGLLSVSWTIAIIFSIPHFYFAPKSDHNQTVADCMEDFPSQESKLSYEFLYLALANLVPILGILVATIQITIALLQSQKRVSRLIRRPIDKVKNVSEDVQSALQEIQTTTVAPGQKSQAKSGPNSGNLLRAAKSVLAVAVVFLICWITHLILSIINSVQESSLVLEMASYIGAVYTCVIPYIYLYGVRKLRCLCMS